VAKDDAFLPQDPVGRRPWDCQLLPTVGRTRRLAERSAGRGLPIAESIIGVAVRNQLTRASSFAMCA